MLKKTVFRVATFLNEVLCEIFELFNIITVQIWAAKYDFDKDFNEDDDVISLIEISTSIINAFCFM